MDGCRPGSARLSVRSQPAPSCSKKRRSAASMQPSPRGSSPACNWCAAYLDRIESVRRQGARAERHHHGEPQGAGDRGGDGRLAAAGKRALAAAPLHPRHRQGQLQHRRHADHRRLGDAGAIGPADDAFVVKRLREAGALDPRQVEPDRAGEGRHDGELARRADEESLRSDAHARRLERRHGRGHRGEFCASSAPAATPANRSDRRPRPRASWACVRRAGWSAATASSRSAPRRMKPGRSRARWRMPRGCSTSIAGYDPADPITAFGLRKIPPSYTAFLDRDGLQRRAHRRAHGLLRQRTPSTGK